VDVVVSVEAAHNYFNDRFAQELFRILKPGGVLVITDGPLQPYESQRQAYPARLKAAGFVVDQFESIADHVAEACRQDTLRRIKPLRWIPSKAVRKELMHSLGCVLARNTKAWWTAAAATTSCARSSLLDACPPRHRPIRRPLRPCQPAGPGWLGGGGGR
jgi:hypothetical protein